MKKIILFILALLIIGGGGSAYYFLKIKTYDLSQDTTLEEIAEEDYEIILPPEEVPQNSDVDTSIIEGNKVEQPVKKKNTPPSLNENGEGTPSKVQAPKVTVQTIKEKYRPSFESLESQANGKISALMGRAYSEYKEKKASGENISVSYFLTKYKTAGEALEAKTDQAFEQVYGALQKELKSNGFDPNEAADVRSAYEAAKKERRNKLLSTAMEKL